MTPANPLAAQQPPQQPQAQMGTSPLMAQAQTALSNPMGQAVPQGGGIEGIANHPLIQKLLQGLSTIAQTAGFTGQSPQERLQRTELNQNKADTLARLAQTGAYQSGELENRANMTKIAGQNADTKSSAEQRMQDMADFTKDIKQQDEDRKQSDSDSKQALGQGRLDLATQIAKQNVSKFEQTYALAKQKFGDQQARTMMIEQGLGIRQQLADTLKTALDQKGTEQGTAALQKFAELRAASPLTMGLLDSLGMGLPDVGSLVNKAQNMGMPGTTPTTPNTAPQQTTPAPTNKIQAKQQQKSKPATSATPSGNVTHIWTPNGIQPVGGPQ